MAFFRKIGKACFRAFRPSEIVDFYDNYGVTSQRNFSFLIPRFNERQIVFNEGNSGVIGLLYGSTFSAGTGMSGVLCCAVNSAWTRSPPAVDCVPPLRGHPLRGSPCLWRQNSFSLRLPAFDTRSTPSQYVVKHPRACIEKEPSARPLR